MPISECMDGWYIPLRRYPSLDYLASLTIEKSNKEVAWMKSCQLLKKTLQLQSHDPPCLDLGGLSPHHPSLCGRSSDGPNRVKALPRGSNTSRSAFRLFTY